jgi:uncharacterized protein YgiM (DUF1202 family)
MKNETYFAPKPVIFTRFSVMILIVVINIFMFSSQPSYGLSPGNELFINKAETIKVAGNIYEKPTANSLAIARAQKGENVTLLVLQGEWYVVKLSSDRLGWAHRNLFSDISAPTSPEKTAIVSDQKTAAMPVIPDKKATEMPAIPDKKATEMPAIPDKKATEMPAIPAATEKKESDSLSADRPEKKIMLKVSAGRVRETPSVQSTVKYILEKGDTVSLVRTEQDWYLVRRQDGSAGWAHSSLFSEPVPMIKSIRFDADAEGNEKVLFALNGYYPPTTFVLEEEKESPKVICDFFGAQLGAEAGRRIEVNGKTVQCIRIGVHEDIPSPKIRVVLDLIPSRNYEVEQQFFEKENIYLLVFKTLSKASDRSR